MQSSETCVLCKGKLDNRQFITCYYSTFSAHLACIEDRICVFCGISGLCVRCQHRECSRCFHQSCFIRYHSFPSNSFCDLHQKSRGKRKELQKVWLIRQVSNRVSHFPEAILKIKEAQSDNKAYSICSGQVFWYIICSQYFSNFSKVAEPEISVKARIDSDEPWECGLDQRIGNLSHELAVVKDQNNEIFRSVVKPESSEYDKIKDIREDEVILGETRNLMLREGFEEYLKYFESKVREETEANGNTEKRLSSLREVPKNEEDFVCSICGDGDYEDDDLIVICSSCEMGAHMKCYGMPVVPEHDWNCHGCSLTHTKEDRMNIRCALCPIKGGCLKPTRHITNGSTSFPNYPEGLGELVWCHVFCATHLEYKVFVDKEFLEDINLLMIDPKRFALRCQVCSTKDGACLQCQYGRCQAAFHPECGKDFFTNTRDKTGYDEISFFCPLHKPLKLRRVLEGREKKCVEDIMNFCKAFERQEKKMKNIVPAVPVVKPVKSQKPFSYEEKLKLMKVVEGEIERLAKDMATEFSLVLKPKYGSLRNQIDVLRPKTYNLLDPQAIVRHKLSIKGRKLSECHKFYSDHLFQVFKKELEIMKSNIVLYAPKVKKKSHGKSHKKSAVKASVAEEVRNDSAPPLTNMPVFQEKSSVAVYCICRKPFLEISVKQYWESELDYEVRLAESQMIQCDRCDEWYHHRCIGFKLGMPIPDNYICTKCSEIKTSTVDNLI